MKSLLILRGAPGAGKSAWIEKMGLKPYAICPDDLRVLCASREMKADGSFSIANNRDVEKEVWKLVFELLEYRMSRGELTVIDGTASKTKDIQKYKDLAEMYRYRKFVVDFTDVPLETCLEQNKMRSEDKIVPEEAIRNIYARFDTQPVPSGIEIIKPDEFYKVLERPIDLSSYRKIVFVGDIHGCYDTLMQYPDFKEGLKDDTEYIFLGDYVDRGNQNAEVMHYLQSIMDKPNVCLLNGNHEKWICDYGLGIEAKSKEFETKTKPQLILGGYTDKMARMFYRKLRQMSHFMWNGIEILACHAGIPNMRTNLVYRPTRDFIHGVGEYDDYQLIADTWMGQTEDNQYLVHGHRNTQSDSAQIADRVFNLEGEVEFGGKLRIVELENVGYCPQYGTTDEGERLPTSSYVAFKWNVVELENCQPIIEETDLATLVKPQTVEEAVTSLRNSRFVQEKKLGDDISSFNFTREAFYKANWDRQTVLARGLFIDTANNKIMARSYNKFFQISEVRETDLLVLKSKLQFPVSAYVKENGFLAIVSYDYKKDDLFVASKSTNQGPYVEYIKKVLEPYREKLLNVLRNSYKFAIETGTPTISYIFECVDIENDPHIIKYDKNKFVLLDIVYNDLEFKTFNYEELKSCAEEIGCPVKELAHTLKSWEEFQALYQATQDEDYQYNGSYIEGYVFMDATGFMTKVKTGYYNFWKHMRGVCDATLRSGYYRRTGSLMTVEANKFYGFCKERFANDRIKELKSYPYKTDIISMRDYYLTGIPTVLLEEKS